MSITNDYPVNRRTYCLIGLIIAFLGVFPAYAGLIIGPSPEFGAGIAIDGEGNVYFSGGPAQTISDSAYVDFSTVTKYDKQGRRLWQRYFRVPGASWARGGSLATDPRGNSYIIGSIRLQPNSERYVCATIKYDPDGNRLWDVRYAADPEYCFDSMGISLDGEGNVYIVGRYEPDPWSDNFSIDSPADSLTIKYNPHGKEVWAKRYGQAQNVRFEPADIAVDGTGHIYVTGGARIDTNDYVIPEYKFATLKYDANGKQLWVSVWPSGEEENDRINSASVVNAQVAGDGCVVVGSSSKEGEYSGMVAIKYDAVGREEWVADYSTSTANWIFVHSIEFADGGNVHVLAFEAPTTTERGYPPKDTIEKMKKREFVTVKYDTDGRELWKAKYKGPEGLVIDPHYLSVDAKNNVYIVGSVGLDAFVIMYDPNGKQQWVRQLKTSSELAKLLSELQY